MDISNIKMVVTDMDGTLLNSNHEVSSYFFQQFKQLKERGIIFVAASGRQYNSMLDKLERIKDDVIFISENGALIKQHNDTMLTTYLDEQNVLTILDAVRTIKNAYPVLCTEDNAYIEGDSNAFIKLLKEYYSAFEIVGNQETVTQNVLKVAIYHMESSEKFIYPAVRQMEDYLKVKVSGSNWLDISHPNAHKGFALQKVMDANQIKGNEILVFGDYNNDLEMMALTPNSFAMANAHKNVKAQATYHTESNDDFGVERILDKLLR